MTSLLHFTLFVEVWKSWITFQQRNHASDIRILSGAKLELNWRVPCRNSNSTREREEAYERSIFRPGDSHSDPVAPLVIPSMTFSIFSFPFSTNPRDSCDAVCRAAAATSRRNHDILDVGGDVFPDRQHIFIFLFKTFYLKIFTCNILL